MIKNYDTVIIGAGAAGLMCAIESGKRGRSTCLIDHSKKIAEKIRISGGGKCNFTNIHTSPENFLSQNEHFCKTALRNYTPSDFIALVDKHRIPFHEKTLGQLFCDESAQNIIDMLLKECDTANVDIYKETSIEEVSCKDGTYTTVTKDAKYKSDSLVIACGGLSIPKIGATPFGYKIAEQFGIYIIPPRAALVPLTFDTDIKQRCRDLTGLSIDAKITSKNNTTFREGMLFTHRGLSGPSILQISSYWKEGEPISINMVPDKDVYEFLIAYKEEHPKQDIQTAIKQLVPKRLADDICAALNVKGRIAEKSKKALQEIADTINNWTIKPCGTEGYRTAEVTIGGVDTNEISSKTFEAKNQKGLFFIGEVVDVTGHLGGFNFQWAWASGYTAGQYV